MSDRRVNVDGSGHLFFFILGLFLLWASCFGVTVDGTHYETVCTFSRGVEIEKSPAKPLGVGR